MPITVCTVTGSVKNIVGDGVSGCIVKASIITPLVHTGSNSLITGEIASTTTDENGDWSLDIVETTSITKKVTFTFDYYDGVSNRLSKKYTVTIPNAASATFYSLIGT